MRKAAVLTMFLAALFLTAALPVFAQVSLSVDGEKKGIYQNLDFPPGTTITQSGTKAQIRNGVEEVTTSLDNQGTAVASLTELLTCVTTTNAGASADIITLADGVAGQIKIITLTSSLETSGLKVTPTNVKGTTTDILLSNTGDTVAFIFDGEAWVVLYTNGTRE